MWLMFSRKTRPIDRNRPRRTSIRPRVEALEDRCLLSGGVLDPTFGSGGLVTTAIGSGSRALAVATYPNQGTANDGKIVAAGDASTGRTNTEYMEVVRYNLDGTLDRTFGGTGEVMALQGAAWAVQVQPDGKVLAAGVSGGHFAVVRYNANGSLDTSFGSTGKVITTISKNSSDAGGAMVLQADGKIVVAGVTNPQNTTYEDLALVRYNANGSLDTSFGTGGKVTTRFAAPLVAGFNDSRVNLAIDPNASLLDPNSGKIVVGAQTHSQPGAVVVRYNTNGTLDTGFGTNHVGYVNLSNLSSPAVAVQSDDRIVVAGVVQGTTNNDIGLDRLNPDGTLDTSFGSAGAVVTSAEPNGDAARSVTLQADGKIVVAGDQNNVVTGANSFLVARYNTNGSLDTAFGVNGIATAGARSIGSNTAALALEPDGRIVVAGYTQDQLPGAFSLARFLAAGPQIGSFAASPNPVTAGASLTLTAANVVDLNPGSSVTQVAFYQDANGDGVLELGTDILLGYATQTNAGTWVLTFSTSGLAPRMYMFFVLAEDSYGAFSDPLAVTVQVS